MPSAIAEAIQDESSKMINDLSAIAREDATRYAREDLDSPMERLKRAREALTAFRVANQIVDVTADIQGQMGLLNTLQAQLAEALIEIDLLTNIRPRGRSAAGAGAAPDRGDRGPDRRRAPEVRHGGDGEGGESYATTVAEFERLTVDREFAERAYVAALSAYDAARAEANRQSRYLAAYISPTLAESSRVSAARADASAWWRCSASCLGRSCRWSLLRPARPPVGRRGDDPLREPVETLPYPRRRAR